MHNYIDPVRRNIEKPPRLKDLEALVHHRRRVYRHLRAHLPARMVQGLGDSHRGKVVRLVEERSAGSRENQAVHKTLTATGEALEDCAMLAVHGKELYATPLRLVRDELAGHYHDLLRRERDIHALLNRSERRTDAGHADCRDKADIGVVLLDCANSCVLADVRLRTELRRKRFARFLRAERGQGDNLEIVRMRPDDIEGVASDGPRGPKYYEPLHVRSPSPRCGASALRGIPRCRAGISRRRS